MPGFGVRFCATLARCRYPRKQANFRNLAKAQLVKMQQLEKKRASLLIHALGGLVAGGFLVGWAVLAVIL